jgi:glycosyltransferase involved in cell wall biosynthesis
MTFEQSWHRVPGGTAVAAVEMARALAGRPTLEVVGIAARHRTSAPEPWVPPVPVHSLPLPRPALYEAWHRLRRPSVQRATGPVDVIHGTAVAVPPRSSPLVMTIHDLAWLRDPAHFTARGLSFFRRGLELALREADLVLCSSLATMRDCEAAGFAGDRLRHVPLGVAMQQATESDIEEIRARYGLWRPYVLWIGTVEPRKNLRRLLLAFNRLDRDVDLVLVGPKGWKEDLDSLIGESRDRIKVLGFVPARDLPPLYSGAEVFCSPSLLEGFGFPVLEAMSQGTPVVTSRGTSTEELAVGAGVLVDPRDAGSIAEGMESVLADPSLAGRLAEAGRHRAAAYTWERTADRVEEAYRDVVGGSLGSARVPHARGRGAVADARPTKVGINLLWLVPGAVGGSENYLARLLSGLAERVSAFDYTLFVLPAFEEAHPELAATFKVAVAPVSGTRRSLRVVAESSWLAAQCWRRKIKLVHHAGGILPWLHPGAAALTIHDLQYLFYPEYFERGKLAYLRTMVPRSAAAARIVLTPSHFTATTVVNRLHVDPGAVQVIPHGISPHGHPCGAEPWRRPDVRSRYELPGPFFLYPAITYPHKNHLLLLEAFARLLKKHAHATLVLTGARGWSEVDVARRARQLGIADRVRRLGHIPAPDLDALYDEATGLTFPSRFEGFGAPVLEAMSRGCPVIVADATALPEVVGAAGMLVPPDDSEAWAGAMEEVLADEELRSKLSKAGIDRAVSFSWTRSAELLEDAYGNVVRDGS